MLACFSIGWYWSIFIMIWTGRPYGKSAAFVTFTVCGYLLGLIAQTLELHHTGHLTYLLVMYGWNLCITLIDLCLLSFLTLRERRRNQHVSAETTISGGRIGPKQAPSILRTAA